MPNPPYFRHVSRQPVQRPEDDHVEAPLRRGAQHRLQLGAGRAVPPDSHSRYSRTTTQLCAARIIRTPPAERRPNQEPHTALGGRLRESPVWLVRRKPAGRTAGLHPWRRDRRQMDSAALPVHRNRGRSSHCLRTHKTWTLRLPPAMTPSSGAATRLDLAQSPHRVLLFCRHCGFGYRLPAHKLRGAGGCRVHKLRIEVIVVSQYPTRD